MFFLGISHDCLVEHDLTIENEDMIGDVNPPGIRNPKRLFNWVPSKYPMKSREVPP